MVPGKVFQTEVGIASGIDWLWAERGVLGRFAMLGGVRSGCVGLAWRRGWRAETLVRKRGLKKDSGFGMELGKV